MRMMVIQPRWAIDEKARIFRTCVWFSPIHPPMAADAMAMVVSRSGFSEGAVKKRIVMGGSFISVERSRAVIIGEPCITSGNQKWKGARPSFIATAVVSSREAVGWVSWVMSHCPVSWALIVLENRISAEAVAWTRKYLIAASTARGWCDFEMKGIIARVLISSPAQAIIQWLLEIVMVVPVRRLRENASFVRGLI